MQALKETFEETLELYEITRADPSPENVRVFLKQVNMQMALNDVFASDAVSPVVKVEIDKINAELVRMLSEFSAAKAPNPLH